MPTKIYMINRLTICTEKYMQTEKFLILEKKEHVVVVMCAPVPLVIITAVVTVHLVCQHLAVRARIVAQVLAVRL
jgi:hypothetical protein